VINDRLLFILSYLKNNPLQEYHGATYGMTQPQCSDRIRLLSDILRKSLKTPGELPERNRLRLEYPAEQCREILPDGTPRPVERPQDSERQRVAIAVKKLRM
jgi:hypothetical protein